MIGIVVKYFKVGDKRLDSFKDEIVPKEKIAEQIQFYKIYFNQCKEPIKVKGFDKKGKNIYESYPYRAVKKKESILQDIYIYRRKNESNVLKKGNRYHFILCNGNGQELDHEIWERNEKTYKQVNEYDTVGRKLSQTHYDIDGSIDRVRKYYYDERGRLLKIEGIQQGLNNMYLGWYNLFHYDENSRCIRKEEFLGNKKLLRVWRYRYSEDDKLVEEKRYKAKSTKCEWWAEYFYGKEAHLLVRERIYMKGSLFREISYAYDTKGHLSRERAFDPEAQRLDSETRYKYNGKGQLIDERSFTRLPDGEIIRDSIEYKYHKGRLQIKTCEF